VDEPKDGRDGRECPDCGAYLQWYTRNGQQFRRCPWANERSWRLFTYTVYTEIYCNWPKASNVPGGVPTVRSAMERL
jgi:hypothetical protein